MAKNVSERRKIVGKMARKTKVVKGIIQLQYPSARAIHAALTRSGTLVSLKSIKRDLQAKGFRNLVRPVVSTRSPKQLAEKRRFAKQEYRDIRAGRKQLPFFSDECWVSTAEGGCRTMWVQHRSQLLPRERKCRWNEAASLQVWGVVGLNYRYLHIMPRYQSNDDGKEVGYTLNSERYIRTCIAPIRAQLRGHRLQQDGARCHHSVAVKNYLMRNGIETFNWPASSPELNMIERVWSILKSAVAELAPTSESELRRAIRTAWNAIPVEVMNRTVNGYLPSLFNAMD